MMMLKSLLLIAALVGDPNVWPTFLGQGASPIDADTIPVNWSATENIAWKTQLPGKGQSSPVIWGDRVFVTSIEGTMKDTCHVVALSLSDGRELWRQSVPAAQPVRSTYTQSRSAPTPAVDVNGVYAFFETGNVVACSHDGQLKWQRDLTSDFGLFETTIGLAASPTVFQDTMILLIDHEGPSYLLGLATDSGQQRWQTERFSRSSYASPTLLQIAGVTQVVCSSSGSVDGYDPSTGQLLWTFEENVGGNRTGAAQPIRDGVFTISGTPGMHNEREELARNTNLAMKIDVVDGEYTPSVLWRTTEAMPAYNSPMSYRGLSYWVTKAGIVYCYDSTSGEQVYAKRAAASGTCWTTPVGIGERIYLFGKDGGTTVLAAGREFQVLAENRLWSSDEAGTATRPGRSMHGDHAEHGGARLPSKAEVTQASATRPSETSSVTNASSASELVATDEGPSTEDASAMPSQLTRRGGRSGSANGSAVSESSGAEPTDGSRSTDARFADPVQYGVAIVNGSLVIRTGELVYCIRKSQ